MKIIVVGQTCAMNSESWYAREIMPLDGDAGVAQTSVTSLDERGRAAWPAHPR